MTANATHPGRVTIPGTDIGVRGTLVAEPQTENMLLSLSDRLALGPVKVDTDPSGNLYDPGLVVPIIADLLWLLRFEPHRHDVAPFELGTFNLNTSGVDLKDLVEPDFLAVTETLALQIAQAAAIGTTNDTATASFVNNPASATRAALSSKYGSKNSHRLTDSPYLAAADGVTSDHAALASAGADAAASGLPVVLPYTAAGYLFSSATNLVSGVTYILEGGVKVKRGGAANANFWNASATTGVTIRGGTFDGNGLVTSTVIAPGIRTSIIGATFQDTGVQPASSFGIGTGTTATTSDVYIRDCVFINNRNNIHVQGNATRWTIENCDISGYGSTAIAVDGSSLARSTDVIIKGNRCHDHNATTRAVTTKQIASNVATITVGSAHPWVVGDTVYIDIGDTNYDGNKTITAKTSTTISFPKTAADSGPAASTGTVTWGNRQPISVQGDDSELMYHERITITGNQVLGNYVGHGATANAGTSDTISVHHAKNVVVADNISEGSGDCGITISYRATGVSVTGNTVVGAANAGVAVGASSASSYVKGLTVSGNTLRNCGQNGVVNWASTGINIRKLTGGLIADNFLTDDQTVPTMAYGITVGDTAGTSTDVHFGPNHAVGVTTAKRLTPAGNVRLTFTDLPTTVTKTADTVYNNTTTLANDPHLFIPLEANAVYEIEGVVGFNTNGVTTTGAPGLKLQFANIAGSTLYWAADSSGSNGTGSSVSTTNSNRSFLVLGGSLAAGGVTGATNTRVMLRGRFTVGTTAGTLQLQAAQNTADATNSTTTVIGSWLKATRVA